MRLFGIVSAWLWGWLLPATAQEIVFPDDPRAVINVQRDCGAKGDGVADDSDALQEAIYRSRGQDHGRTIYLPKGTYRITRPIVFTPSAKGGEGSMVGAWIYGQDRDATIIRLADRAEGYGDPAKPKEAIRGVSRPDGARMNADFFDRTLNNLTIDTGDNPGAIGIKFYSNNTGLLKRVRIVGKGTCGIDLGSHDQNGPHLIQDVEIDGFATGIRTGHGINSQTLSRVTVRRAQLGLFHRGQVLAVEGLTVLGAPLAVDSDAGVLTLVDCRFETADAQGPAVTLGGKGHLYAQRLLTKGYAAAIAGPNAAGRDGAGPNVAEYRSHAATRLDLRAAETGLGLTPLPEPVVPLERDPKKWVCANDHGAAAGDNGDDAEAIQKAIDHAARIGATTVYLLGGKRGDPNWYHLKKDVTVHGSVERLWGFGFVRILGGDSSDPKYPDNLAKFVVEDEPKGPPVVVFEHLHVFSPVPSFGIEARSKQRTVVCQTTGGTGIARSGARLFMTNCVGHAYLEPGATAYLRQWNTEGSPKTLRVNTRNDGGTLWILGMKTESDGTKVLTKGGGKTEILGTLIYNTSGVKDDTPCLAVENGSLSSAGHREVCFVNAWWKIPVLEKAGEVERRLPGKPWLTWSLLRVGP